MAVILLHGFTQTHRSWDGISEALGERYRQRAPDLRGHGEASARRPVTLEAVLDDLGGLIEAPVALVGYSMGGRIALHAALALQDRIERLVLIGASPGIEDPAQRAQRREADERLAEAIERQSIEEFAERWAATPVLADQPAHVRQAAHADRLRSEPAGLAAALRGLGTGALPSLWERLGELAMPVTLIIGERDQKFRGIAEAMAVRMPHARVRVIPEAGHAAHLEAPERVARLLTMD